MARKRCLSPFSKLTLHCKAKESRIGADGLISYEKGTAMRVIGVSLIVAGVGAGLGFALFGRSPDWTGVSLLLGLTGAIIGAIAGASREIAAALRQKPSI